MMDKVDSLRELYREVQFLRGTKLHSAMDEAWENFHDACVDDLREVLGLPGNAPWKAIIDEICELKEEVRDGRH
jgi:hypothetical protein